MSNLVQGKDGLWEVVIGLEVHAQIASKSKLFSAASAAFGAGANENVSLIDAAMPGMLPVINRFCVEQAVKTGLGLNATINLFSVFDRKNYFYADLPQGYQISQYKQPVVGEGSITIDCADGSTKAIGIERLHLEQDAGKSLHDQHPSKSFIDLNRSGVALMEIVSRPDMRSAAEAAAYISKLRSILRFLGSCDGNMEEGSLRADCNVSVRREGSAELGIRTETKNLNSIRFIAQAINYEVARQIEILEGGGTVEQETRLFDTASGVTRAMRSKEDAHDYRYFPDPDLLPLVLDSAWVEGLRATLPELPDALKARLMEQYGLGAYDASVLSEDKATAAFYEAVVSGVAGADGVRGVAEADAGGVSGADGMTGGGGAGATGGGDAPKLAANWVIVELFGVLNKLGVGLAASPVAPEALGALVGLISDGTISGRIAKTVFAEMVASGDSAAAIVEKKGLKQVSDAGVIEAMVATVLAENLDKVAEYKAGKDKLFGFFVGQIMKASQGQANPALVNEVLRRKLGE